MGRRGRRRRRPAAGSMRCWRRPFPAFSRSRIKDLIVAGARRDQWRKPSREPNYRLKAGEAIAARRPAADRRRPRAREHPARRSSTRTTQLIVIDKPVGHGGPPRARQPHAARWSTPCSTTAATASSGIGGVKRPGIVHRLDKDTSGVMVAAKTERAHAAPRGAVRRPRPHRAAPPRLHRLRLGRDRAGPAAPSTPRSAATSNNRLKQAVRRDGREAITHYAVEQRFGAEGWDITQLALRARNRPHPPDPRAHGAYRPSAGRRPALRPRLRHQGQPAAGGARRRPSAASAGRRCTPRSLGFEHPATGEEMVFESPLPPDLAGAGRRARPVRSRLRPLNTAARALKPAGAGHVAASAPGLIIAELRPISSQCLAPCRLGRSRAIRPRSRGNKGVFSWPRPICRSSPPREASAAICRKSASSRCLNPNEEFMLAKRYKEHAGSRRGPETHHVPSAARGEDRHGLSRLWPAHLRGDLGGQCRPDARGQALRARQGLPPRDLRDVVDPRRHPGIRAPLVVAGEDRHDRGAEAAVLQPAQGEGPDRRARRRRAPSRADQADRDDALGHRGRRRLDEPAPHRRRLAQRADARRRGRVRVAGLAGRRHAGPGDDARRQRGIHRAHGPPHRSHGRPQRPRAGDLPGPPPARRTRRRSKSSRRSTTSRRERIRQIEVRAFEKVQDAVQTAARDKAREQENA